VFERGQVISEMLERQNSLMVVTDELVGLGQEKELEVMKWVMVEDSD